VKIARRFFTQLAIGGDYGFFLAIHNLGVEFFYGVAACSYVILGSASSRLGSGDRGVTSAFKGELGRRFPQLCSVAFGRGTASGPHVALLVEVFRRYLAFEKSHG
jgi:hypothetical protein